MKYNEKYKWRRKTNLRVHFIQSKPQRVEKQYSVREEDSHESSGGLIFRFCCSKNA